MTTCNNIILAQPTANTTVQYTIPQGDTARLNFAPEEISGLRLGQSGELIVSFRDGGQLIITNFEELTDGSSQLFLSDGTLIDPARLTSGLQAPSVLTHVIQNEPVTIQKPESNTTQEIALQSGQKYICDFDPANAALVEVKDGQMVLTFADGSQVVINNYQQAMSGELPPELTVADGSVISEEQLLTQVTEAIKPVEEVLQISTAEPKEETIEVATIEPAAGDKAAPQPQGDELAELAQALADIETAAGETGGAASGGGYGFNSSPVDVPLDSKDAIGPLGPTQLAYQAPQADPNGFIPVSPLSPSAPDHDPINISGAHGTDDTHLTLGSDVVNGVITVDYQGDGPGTTTGNGVFSVNGNIAGGTLTSNGHAVTVSYDASTQTYTGVANGAAVFTLVIHDDATYSFTQIEQLDHSDTSNNNEALYLHFGVTATDNDGDVGTGTVTITVLDDAPTLLSQTPAELDETHLQDGALVYTGRFVADIGQDKEGQIVGNNEFVASGSLKEGVLSSHGTPITVAFNPATNTYTGIAGTATVFTITINAATGHYTYTQHEPFDHANMTDSNDVITLDFGASAVDHDGDKVSGRITINVADDGPTAVNDTAAIANNQTQVSGNVLTNDKVGEDNSSSAVMTPGTYVGTYGTLVLNANGTYTYTRNGNTGGEDTFPYTMRDADGDTSSAILKVTVENDYSPITISGEGLTDDTHLASGSDVVNGVITVDYQGDGPGTTTGNGDFASSGNRTGNVLSFNGAPVTVAFNPATNTYTGTAGTATVFTMVIHSDNSYTFTQLEQLDHSDNTHNNEPIYLDFGVTATDSDGDTGTGTVRITVLDDVPLAYNDTATLTNTTATGNVLTNDHGGADGVGAVKSVTFNGTTYNVPTVGTAVVVGLYGKLTLAADGSYTYERLGDAVGTDTFRYTMYDGDGDTSSANLSLTVAQNLSVDVRVNNLVDDVCVKEDHSVDVPVAANVIGGSGNETLTLTLTGVNPSWGFVANGWTKNADGSYSITLPKGQTAYNGTFKFTPPANSDIDLSGLKVTASVQDPDLTNPVKDEDGFTVIVDAVADAPTLKVELPTSSNDDPGRWTFSNYYNYKYWGQGKQYDFTLKASVTDTDGSEKLDYFIIKVPKVLEDFGIGFNKGTEIEPGVWHIAAGQEAGLQIVFPEILKVDGKWWKNPDYIIPQGIHNFEVTAYTKEYQLNGHECDTTDNKAHAVADVKVVIFSSPLVLDLNGDGLNLTDADHGVLFDINADGVKDQTGWVSREDGLLALDINGNGQIDNQSELFGGVAEDGFTTLARHDSNQDGVINSKDSVWNNLKVWQDLNQDGLSQGDELKGLDDHGITSIALDAKAVDYQIAGNGVSAESTVTTIDGGEMLIADAWFAFYNGADAEQIASYEANQALFQTIEEASSTLIALDNEDVLDIAQLIDSGDDVTQAIHDFVYITTEETAVEAIDPINDNAVAPTLQVALGIENVDTLLESIPIV